MLTTLLRIIRGADALVSAYAPPPADTDAFSPAAFFEPGERTGKFRLGTKELIADSKGESLISMEGYAIALVDEFENPVHRRAQFSIGY